jgi:hypothetical protein
MAEWTESHRLADGVRNAADVYEEAFALFAYPPDDANVPVLGQGRSPDRGSAWPPGMVKDVATYLANQRPCLDRLYAAAGIEHCWYNWDILAGRHNFGGLRSCARLLDLEMLYLAQKGDADGAVASFRVGLRLADSLRQEPLLLTYLVRASCASLLLAGLEKALSVTAFTEEQLRQMDEILAHTVTSWDFTEVIVGERCWVIEVWRDPQLHRNSIGPGARLDSSLATEGRLLDLLDYMDDCVEASKLPPAQRLTRFREIDARAQGLSFWRSVTRSDSPVCGSVALLDLRHLAHLDLARTALALERHRLATGRVPEQLDDLVPQYLKEVPLDPFDGKPLRYRRREPGYLLYSILEDGQDNGGRQKPGFDDPAPYDLPFIVTR